MTYRFLINHAPNPLDSFQLPRVILFPAHLTVFVDIVLLCNISIVFYQSGTRLKFALQSINNDSPGDYTLLIGDCVSNQNIEIVESEKKLTYFGICDVHT